MQQLIIYKFCSLLFCLTLSQPSGGHTVLFPFYKQIVRLIGLPIYKSVIDQAGTHTWIFSLQGQSYLYATTKLYNERYKIFHFQLWPCSVQTTGILISVGEKGQVKQKLIRTEFRYMKAQMVLSKQEMVTSLSRIICHRASS